MPASIGVNLRVTGHCRQGGRKYMEDFFSVAYQQTEDERDLEYAFFGIYDGHGGAEAAAFAREHLMENIIKHRSFWSDNDEDVLNAIRDGFMATHYAMWKEQEKWPKTASGLPSTAGTTASVAFIRHGKIYIGHVGDSGIILGYQENGCGDWRARQLTKDHKPENLDEMERITRCGGKVAVKSGVPRVVWNRPRMGHQGPVRRSTPIDEIPFLAVARSLGDLWSYNSQLDLFIVSPMPDCHVIDIDTKEHRCLIFGTDGLFNMLRPQNCVQIVQQAEKHNELVTLNETNIKLHKSWRNPSKLLVEKALNRWYTTKMRADNTSVVTLMLDPPGPPRIQVLKLLREQQQQQQQQKLEEEVEEESGYNNDVISDVENSVINSSSDVFPLKERNFNNNTNNNNCNGKTKDCDFNMDCKENTENNDSIQINEITSSSNDDDDDNNNNNGNDNSNNKKSEGCVTRATKRKLNELEEYEEEKCKMLRKSRRINSILQQKKIEMNNNNNKKKKCTTIKLSLTQRILKSKKLNMKKQNLNNKIINDNNNKKKKRIFRVLRKLKEEKIDNEKCNKILRKQMKGKNENFQRGVQGRMSIRRRRQPKRSSTIVIAAPKAKGKLLKKRINTKK